MRLLLLLGIAGLIAVASAAFQSVSALAQGGPPMVTDDPGTPGDRKWEINIAGLLASAPGQVFVQLPYFDINYGLGERVQLKVETGWAILGGLGSQARSGAGPVLAGVKARFLDEERAGVSVSTYPQFQFRSVLSSGDPELAEAGEQYIVPIEVSKTFGNWELNPEVGFLYSTEFSSELFYGVVLAFEAAKPWEPLAEVHVNTRLDGHGSATLLNFGARYALLPEMNLLFAIGHTVTSLDGLQTELDIYAGLQLAL